MKGFIVRARLLLLGATCIIAPGAAAQPATPSRAAGVPTITNIRYELTFDSTTARRRSLSVAMHFDVAAAELVLLSIPAWTPGAYELSNYARNVSAFKAESRGRGLSWDKTDYDTWRVRPTAAGTVDIGFEFLADTLDNAMAWSKPDFLLVNGTNVFPYPEGIGFDFPARVSVTTTPGWRVATGLDPDGGPGRYRAVNYHDLVDMPFFVGRFDLDSARVADRWVRFASYPAGSVSGARRTLVWDQLKKLIPPQTAVFGETPFTTYTVMQIADSSYGGASGLEHQNSHVDVINPAAIGHPFMPSLYAHEIFHAWNIKRLRPADLWPYQYAHEQPTSWLWVSEGITDYYADLAEVRGGVVDSAGFFALTAAKIQEVSGTPPVALDDASLSTWVHPTDGTGYIYYPKGSLAGLLLDVMIRDASDNRRSLDDVMRQIYRDTYKQGRGFTGDEWWRAVSAAAGGKSFEEFNRRYIEGREPYPWATVLPLAGMRLAVDTVPRLGVNTLPTEQGVIVTGVASGSAAEAAGVRGGDILLSVGDIEVTDEQFGQKFRSRFGRQGGAPLAIRVRRDGRPVTLNAKVQLGPGDLRVEADRAASPKAARIRSGILRGEVDK
jgi:predicted metalloprotease with PDZ domain